MYKVIIKNMAPLVALFIFVLGNGLFGTYLANVLAVQQESSITIGMMTTFLYAGLVIGSFNIEKLIARVAHIRAYAAFASLIAVIPLIHLLCHDIYFWFVLRLIYGVATAGIYIVIESWLLSHATAKSRGQVLALYMVTFYASQSLGQLLLKLDNQQGIIIYVMISILTSLSVVPMALTKASLPIHSEASTLNLSSIYKKCASGLFGCLFGGLILGALYGLFPVFLLKNLGRTDAVANNMFILILGGMLLQYPIGKVSDLIERRLVLLFICIASLGILALMTLTLANHAAFLLLTLLLGGCTFTIYPVSISYGCDNLEPKDIVSGTQTLLLAYSVGAMIGPVIASLFMSLSQWGLIAYLSICCLVLMILMGWRKKVSEPSAQDEQFITITQNTPVIMEVDPRIEDKAD